MVEDIKEGKIEDYFCKRIKEIHIEALALKMVATFFTGIPDRLVIVPYILEFVELKRSKGGVLSKRQLWVHAWLQRLHIRVTVLKNYPEIDTYIETLKARIWYIQQGRMIK